MKISYDWKGMPIEFILQQQPTRSSGNSLFRLTMAYDGSGRRISKTRWVKSANSQDWEKELVTHYTGIGTEVRESFTGPAGETKVVVNMPNGLGRYGIEDAAAANANASKNFEWYLKNHLGSTMLVYGTVASTNPSEADVGEKIAAYDYRAFGEMLELTPPPTGKVTENFTGKERDDEIALDYFGARYFDPMLGMWTSVDPARQFASTYLYAGNGVNPIGGIDPSGMYFTDGERRTEGEFVSPELYPEADSLFVSKKAYFDKGDHVYDMTYAKDIYGCTTHVSYKDAADKTLYSETATYPSVVAGRLATALHVWDGYSSNESYSYDKQGHLTGYTTDNSNIGSGAYGYDGLGRLLSKREGDTTISYTYINTLFRPMMMNVNNSTDTTYYFYDPSGNVWIDRNSKNTYTINALGLPSRVRLFSNDPENTTYDEVLSDAYLTGQIGFMDMAYDEGGQRIWTKFVVGAPAHETKVTYPGIGEYTYFGQYHSNDLTLTRIDLLGGGYRTGLNGEALFPVKDLQGSIRGYANKTGLKSAFGYRPYGTTVDLARYASDSDERWQGKEFDGEHGKLYFGARFYDPFFGMWISPDPAGQFANPYSYGGDPLNYIDPTGLWALSICGLVIGHDDQHGWSFGVGFAAEFGDFGYNASFSFNQDGSKSLSLGANVKLPIQTPWVYLEINMGLGFAMNSYSGATLSSHGGVCVGEATACVGVEQGGSMYFDRSGGFRGATIYTEVYAQYGGPYGGVRISTGYEAGLFGAEGRGMYAGADLLGSLHNEYKTITLESDLYLGFSQRDGFDSRFSAKFDLDPIEMSYYGQPRSKGVKARGHGYKADNDANRPEFDAYKSGEMDKNGEFAIGGHGMEDEPYMLAGNQIVDAAELYAKVKDLKGFSEAKTIKLNVCYAGATKNGRNFAQEFANISGKIVIASEHKVTFWTRNKVWAGGIFTPWYWSDWQTFRPSNN